MCMSIIFKRVHTSRRLVNFLLLAKPLATQVPVCLGDGPITLTFCSSNKSQFVCHSFSWKCICLVELGSPANPTSCLRSCKSVLKKPFLSTSSSQAGLFASNISSIWEHLQNANLRPTESETLQFKHSDLCSYWLIGESTTRPSVGATSPLKQFNVKMLLRHQCS